MTTTLTTVEAREKFAELINRVTLQHERVVLTRRGKAIAAVIPLEDLQFIQDLQDKQDLDEASNALKEAREQGTYTLEQLQDEIGS